MPAARPRPAYPQTDRCRFADRDGVRCRRVATVAGGFCRQCAIALELELDDHGPGKTILGALDRVLSRRQAKDPIAGMVADAIGGVFAGATTPGGRFMPKLTPSQSRALDQARRLAQDLAREALQKKMEQQRQARADAAARAAAQAHRQAPPPRPPPAARVKVDPQLAARAILGFEPDEKLTAERVKDRKRQLAAVFHPDKAGGSTAQMQKVNVAADTLLAKLS